MKILSDTLNLKMHKTLQNQAKFACAQLKEMQGRHRQFYKVQLHTHQLDKFKPEKETKDVLEYFRLQKIINRKEKEGQPMEFSAENKKRQTIQQQI